MLFRRKLTNQTSPPSYLGLLIVAIVVATLGLRVYEWIKPETTRPLLTQAEGMIEIKKIEDLAFSSQTPVTLPSQLFGSEIFTIGIYQNETSAFSKDSVAIVLTREQSRFVEIDYLPNTTFESQTQKYKTVPTEHVLISPNVNGLFVRLRSQFDCIDPSKTSAPSFCQFTRVLLFEQNGVLIKLFADGDHVSDGELLEMARSIK